MITFLCPKCKTIGKVSYLRAWKYPVKFDTGPKIDFESGQVQNCILCEACQSCIKGEIVDYLVEVAIDDQGNVVSVNELGEYWKSTNINPEDVKL